MISEAVILAIATLGAGVIGLVARLIYSSKCVLVRCCCCEVQRKTDQEQSARNITGDLRSN
jgi:hypothetical protein